MKKFEDRINEFQEIKKTIRKVYPFGVSFLDQATGGISQNDLVVLSARTGGGKTELASHIASVNSALGNKVLFFALEAHENEIEMRMTYRMLAQNFFALDKHRETNKAINYQDWILGKLDNEMAPWEPEILETLKEKHKTLFTIYRRREFDVDSLITALIEYMHFADIVIVDHLHFMDLPDDQSENSALKRIMKELRDMALLLRKPVVLLCQMRKADKRFKNIIADHEEIHGSSDIAKIATKIIITGPAKSVRSSAPTLLPTFFRLCKNRTDGSRCRYIGLQNFDISLNKYEDNFKLGELDAEETDFEEIDIASEKWPRWAVKNGENR